MFLCGTYHSAANVHSCFIDSKCLQKRFKGSGDSVCYGSASGQWSWPLCTAVQGYFEKWLGPTGTTDPAAWLGLFLQSPKPGHSFRCIKKLTSLPPLLNSICSLRHVSVHKCFLPIVTCSPPPVSPCHCVSAGGRRKSLMNLLGRFGGLWQDP